MKGDERKRNEMNRKEGGGGWYDDNGHRVGFLLGGGDRWKGGVEWAGWYEVHECVSEGGGMERERRREERRGEERIEHDMLNAHVSVICLRIVIVERRTQVLEGRRGEKKLCYATKMPSWVNEMK